MMLFTHTILLWIFCFPCTSSAAFYVVRSPLPRSIRSTFTKTCSRRRKMSEWGDFQALDDDEDIEVDMTEYAKEEDSQEYKAQVGSSLQPPSIEWNAEPIQVPQGTVLELSVDNVLGVLAACREEIGTLFGYSEENRGVGITGGVDFVELDGPCVILRLKGRFWHQRTTVLNRVGSYLMGRIPEIISVEVEDEYQLTDEANNNAD